jgi:carbamate kinase
MLALQSELDASVGSYPLDVLGAETEGMIGYLLERELRNQLPDREVATLITQVEVDPRDPAFDAPTKPIGRIHPHADAERLAREHGWQFVEESGGLRRVVPSPAPLAILESRVIRSLLATDTLVVCAGGGGVPVVRRTAASGRQELFGVEAVIDKDATSARLAQDLAAGRLLLLTDVDAVYLNFGSTRAVPCATLDESQIPDLCLPPGSMGPKVEAARLFAAATGGVAAIGKLDSALEISQGLAGTRIVAGRSGD